MRGCYSAYYTHALAQCLATVSPQQILSFIIRKPRLYYLHVFVFMFCECHIPSAWHSALNIFTH